MALNLFSIYLENLLENFLEELGFDEVEGVSPDGSELDRWEVNLTKKITEFQVGARFSYLGKISGSKSMSK